MHILFIGYGKTSQRIAKQLFEQGHQITTISRSPKSDNLATHLMQDVQQINLTHVAPIDCVYVLLSPSRVKQEGYQHTYLDSIEPIVTALKYHPIQKLVVVSSTRVYGESHGQVINDESWPEPNDAQGKLLLKMEQLYQQAFPKQSIIIRPTGIYGTSVERMITLAETTKIYPDMHYSNRIHIDDLAGFLAQVIQLQSPEKSYIVSNNTPIALHHIIQWFQQQLGLTELVLAQEQLSGKQIYATRMQNTGFQLQHVDCFKDYLDMLAQR